jgi:vanillate O-demethylase ferredoxin subunit
MSLGAGELLSVEVTDVRAEARDVMLVELRATGGAQLVPFDPGAHLEVNLPNGMVRHYSLVNDGRAPDHYLIGVGRAANGRGGSEFVHRSVRRGTPLKISAPRNNFRLAPQAQAHLFIAGGIGITPIMAMVRWCEANAQPWQLIYAARNRQRAAFYETLRGYDASRVHFHFDDERDAVLDVSRHLAEVGPGVHVYCCGPQPLNQAVKNASSHWPQEAVHFEYFVAPDEPPPGATEPGTFTIELRRSGGSLVVPPDKSILDVLEENGHRHPFSCREGLCRTCETTVCEGEVEHRDYVLSSEEREAGQSMMVCVSRARSGVLVLDL